MLNVLGSPAPASIRTRRRAVTAGEAVRAVQDAVGVYRSLPRDRGPVGATRATEYADGTDAELTLYRDRLAWRVTYAAASDAVYDAIVDAETGRVVKQANLVKSAAGDALVWERYPGRRAGRHAATRNLADARLPDRGATTLSGPNVRAFSDLDDDNVHRRRRGDRERRGGTFAFALTPFAGRGLRRRRTCARGTPPARTAGTTNRAQNGVQAFYFANRFHDHLEAAPIGFTDRRVRGRRPADPADRRRRRDRAGRRSTSTTRT